MWGNNTASRDMSLEPIHEFRCSFQGRERKQNEYQQSTTTEKRKQKLTNNLWFLLEMVFDFCWRREASNIAFDGSVHNFTRWVSLFSKDRNLGRWVLEIWDGISSVLEMGIWWHGLEIKIRELGIGFGECWDLGRREAACVKEEERSF